MPKSVNNAESLGFDQFLHRSFNHLVHVDWTNDFLSTDSMESSLPFLISHAVLICGREPLVQPSKGVPLFYLIFSIV